MSFDCRHHQKDVPPLAGRRWQCDICRRWLQAQECKMLDIDGMKNSMPQVLRMDDIVLKAIVRLQKRNLLCEEVP